MTSLNRRLIIASGVVVTLTAILIVLISIASSQTAREFTIATAGGLGLAAVLFAVFVAWHGRAAGRYRRRFVAGSGATAPPAHGAGVRETIVLDRAFNTMSTSLQDAREKLRRLLEEQAALRRVATLVAHGESPSAIFFAVAKEVGRVLGADLTRVLRYEPDEATTVIAAWGDPGELLPVDTCWTIVGSNIPSMVLHRSAPARMDCFDDAVSPLCVYLRRHGVMSGVGTPIRVNDG